MAKVFRDANVVMYLVGSPHPNKLGAAAVLQRLTANGNKFLTDGEVFQEMLHRYSAVNRREAIQPAFDLLHAITEQTLDITLATVQSARIILQSYPSLSARDAIHVAAMQSADLTQVFSFDTGFDTVPTLQRIFQ